MEKKINIAELLKDCPKGMELDCTMFDNVTFVGVEYGRHFPIEIAVGGVRSKFLTKEGCFHNNLPEAKCVIFPKGKATWEGFVPPYQFKDGDIVISYLGNIHILKDYTTSYCFCDGMGHLNKTLTNNIAVVRLATETEKQKLFDSIKASGCKWNPKTNTLEKLVKPIFKVGDIIQDENRYKVRITDVSIEDEFYKYESLTINGVGGISFNRQDDWVLVQKFKIGDKVRHKNDKTVITITGIKDNYYLTQFYNISRCDYQNEKFSFKDLDEFELVPDKFDLTTLKPFDKVLVRDNEKQKWGISFFSHCNGLGTYKYSCINGCGYARCIPYEDNKYLLDTTDDCDEFYKTWG